MWMAVMCHPAERSSEQNCRVVVGGLAGCTCATKTWRPLWMRAPSIMLCWYFQNCEWLLHPMDRGQCTRYPPTVQSSFLFNAMSRSLDDESIWARGHRLCSKRLPDLSGSTAIMTSNGIACFDTESKKCPLLAPCIIHSKRKLLHAT